MIFIRPKVAMFGAFSRMNYKPWFAIAEFVDNAIQSHVANREKLAQAGGGEAALTVRIQVEPDQITVTDNAAGIAAPDFARAFLPAERPPDTSGLSEYGLGMKAAACWFSNRWHVRTRALGEDVERTVHFDVPRIIQNHVETLEEEVHPGRGASGTTLTLEASQHAAAGPDGLEDKEPPRIHVSVLPATG